MKAERLWTTGMLAAALCACGLLWAGSPAQAFSVDTGVSDLRLNWDTMVKYSVGMRTESRDSQLLTNPNNDDGDRNFDVGSLIFNRFDLYTELDAAYKGFGVRLSGAGWYDFVYNSPNDNDSEATSNRIPQRKHDEFSDGTRKAHGRKAELLDAFVFGKVDLGDTTLSARAGKYALNWGESLFFGNNGIAGGMSPVDVVKLLSSPNSTFKEFIRPTPQVSAQYVITPELTVGGYYKLGWDKVAIPGIGSYFSNEDVVGPGAESIVGPGFRRGDDMDAKNSGQGGIQVKFRPGGGLDLGAYAIRFHDMGPQVYVYLSPILTPGGPVPVPDTYRLIYPENIQAYGLSATKTFGSFNWATEVSMRKNMDLPSTRIPAIIEAFGVNAKADNSSGSHALYASGNTLHAQINWLAGLGPSFIANEADFLGEIAWNRLLKITDNESALDPDATKNAWGFRLVYEPKYRQVAPGLDLSIPVGFAYFPNGKSSALTNFGPDKGGDMSLGITGTYLDVWRMSLNYTHYYGPRGTFQHPDGTFTYAQSLADRDFVAFSVRRTF